MHKEQIIYAGNKLGVAKNALIMLHGRGGSAEDVISLADHLHIKDFALVAPQATNNSWYPNSFLAPAQQNEPWLSSALNLISELVVNLENQGISKENMYFLGFSQGACLTMEFVARNATKYGGIIAFTGGLIGDVIDTGNYKGDFKGTPIFIGTSDPDPHVPVERVDASAEILKNMGAVVTKKVYKNMGHTINQDEIDTANGLFFDNENRLF